MGRFLKETDYDGRIKSEIKKIVTATLDGTPSAAQITAEDTAVQMIREYIGGRYDCDVIFADPGDPDTRNKWIVKCVIVITLYDLYHQTGMKDIPEHRASDYDDTVKWLTKVGSGLIPTTLPPLAEEVNPGDIRINSRTPVNHKW